MSGDRAYGNTSALTDGVGFFFSPKLVEWLGPRRTDDAADEPYVHYAAAIQKLFEERCLELIETHLGAILRETGRIAFAGETDEVTGTRFAIYLEAWTNPRKAASLDPCDGTSGDDGTLTSHPDPVQRLPHPRRLGQAFCSFLEAVDPKRLPIHGGNATQLMVAIDFESLCAKYGAGDLLTTAAIPGEVSATAGQLTASQVRRLACNAEIIPVVLGNKSQILDYGYDRRLFSPAQKRALLLRDRTCRAEGCNIPGTWAEAHHWIPWATLRNTDLDNGVLLCSHHHHRAHEEDTWHLDRLPNGDVRFTRRR